MLFEPWLVCDFGCSVLTLKAMHSWSFLYLYIVGGFFYLLGSILVIRAGVLDLKSPKDRNMYWIMTVCLVLFACIHGYFQLVLAPEAGQ